MYPFVLALVCCGSFETILFGSRAEQNSVDSFPICIQTETDVWDNVGGLDWICLIASLASLGS